MLEWPVLLVTGMLVPLSLLPTWSHPIAWVLAPTWGVQAIREAALGGTPWPDIGMTVLLGGTYLALGALFLRHSRSPSAQAGDALADMNVLLRVFFIGGEDCVPRALQLDPAGVYIPTMLIGPVFQILFFSYLGRYSGVEDDTFFVVGNAVQASAMSGVFAATMAIANERQFQTLSPLLATPANRFAIFMGRSLPVVASGLLVSAWGFLMGWLLLDFHPPLSSIPALADSCLVSVVSCTAFGLTLGSVGMRARDVFLIANVAYYLMWLFCGVNIPLARSRLDRPDRPAAAAHARDRGRPRGRGRRIAVLRVGPRLDRGGGRAGVGHDSVHPPALVRVPGPASGFPGDVLGAERADHGDADRDDGDADHTEPAEPLATEDRRPDRSERGDCGRAPQ